jgi:uncharacterized protein YndB with AHSA1/START domain
MQTKNETSITAETGRLDVVITREFEAPRELVFKAFIDAELLSQWLGPKKHVMEVDIFEPRSGGAYRYIHISPNGYRYGFHGVFHEITAPERIIQTFEYEGLPEKGHVSLGTATLEALPSNRTRLTLQSVFQSVEDRDGMMKSGMEMGVREGHERLDEMLEKGAVK